MKTLLILSVTMTIIGCDIIEADPLDHRPLMLLHREVIEASTQKHWNLHQQCQSGDRAACQENCTNHDWPDGADCRTLCQLGDPAACIDYVNLCGSIYPCVR